MNIQVSKFPPITYGASNKKTFYKNAIHLSTSTQPLDTYVLHGTNLFLKFQKFELEDTNRCKDKRHNKLIDSMRSKQNLTPDMLKSLNILTTKDTQNSEWSFAPYAVTTNSLRHMINHKQLIRYAKMKSESILSWNCPVKTGRSTYDDVLSYNQFFKKLYPSLTQYFVKGLKCINDSNKYFEKYGLPRGAEITMQSLVWKDNRKRPTLKKLQIGDIHNVTQPIYIVVKYKNKLIPIKYEDCSEKIRKSKNTRSTIDTDKKKLKFQGHASSTQRLCCLFVRCLTTLF